ncbi:MAG: hypothetical protein HYX39_07890 [Bacteroidetes bacterium]|nr:hypothetical protein [Bacteroidota bacterium]
MKRLIVCASCLIVSIQLSAQTITPTATIIPGGGKGASISTNKKKKTAIPETIINKFNEDFPGNSNINWKAEDNNYVVTYTDSKTNMDNIIVYDKEGKVIRKENEVK